MPGEWLLYMCQLNSPVTGPHVLCKETSYADPDQNQKDWLISGAQKYKDWLEIWNKLKQIPIPAVIPLSPSGPHLHTYPSNLYNICPWMQKLILALQMAKAPGDADAAVLLYDPPPTGLATSGDCRIDQVDYSASLVQNHAPPQTWCQCHQLLQGDAERGLPWNHVTFSKSSMTQEDDNAQSNVLDTPKGVSQTTDLAVYLYYSQRATAAGKYFRQTACILSASFFLQQKWEILQR